ILDTQKDRMLMLKTHFPFSEQHPHIENAFLPICKLMDVWNFLLNLGAGLDVAEQVVAKQKPEVRVT
ncbi:MAG: hypothetical protein AAFW75_26200, partial [Cyanobacteria bacterium J06636_16]